MSDPIAKNERSKAKDNRQKPIGDNIIRFGKRKPKDRKFVVEGRGLNTEKPFGKSWRKWGSYVSADVAITAMKGFKRKYGEWMEFRLICK